MASAEQEAAGSLTIACSRAAQGHPCSWFLAFVVCAAAFAWLPGLALPDLVASHFGASGTADGFMPRAFYIGFMLAFVLGLPVLSAFFARWRKSWTNTMSVQLQWTLTSTHITHLDA